MIHVGYIVLYCCIMLHLVSKGFNFKGNCTASTRLRQTYCCDKLSLPFLFRGERANVSTKLAVRILKPIMNGHTSMLWASSKFRMPPGNHLSSSQYGSKRPLWGINLLHIDQFIFHLAEVEGIIVYKLRCNCYITSLYQGTCLLCQNTMLMSPPESASPELMW